MLKVCIFDLLLAIDRLQPLAKAPEHAEIRLLRQQEPSTVLDARPIALPTTHATTLTQLQQ